jgi:hypothetical protein
VFDWTILETLAALLDSGRVSPTIEGGGCLVLASTTDKTERQIPPDRREAWKRLKAAEAVETRQQPPGRYFGAGRREVLSERSDALIAVSGGAGLEHLCDLYIATGKPVIPLDLKLGASQEDGSGGAAALYGLARFDSRQFFRLENETLAGAMLDGIGSDESRRAPSAVVGGLEKLIDRMRNPRIFYVRMLNRKVPAFSAVERYFRGVVDPVVTSLGYEGFQAGAEVAEHAWMNQEIFEGLRRSAGAIVDLTGMRANCYAELGFMLGQARMTLVSAMYGSQIAFDVQQYETYFWSPRAGDPRRQAGLLDYWYRTAGRPPIVRLRNTR